MRISLCIARTCCLAVVIFGKGLLFLLYGLFCGYACDATQSYFSNTGSMDLTNDKPPVCMSKLIIPNDKRLEIDEFADNHQQNVSVSSSALIRESLNESPILGRRFQLPDFSKSYIPDPPKLDDSLPYIPVYTHLITHDLVPIERPNTPPFIKMLRLGRTMESKNLDFSPRTPKACDTNDQNDETISFTEKSMQRH